MMKLFNTRHLFALLAITFLMFGCNERMTYQQFISRLQEQCPQYYTHKDIEPHKKQRVCDCMLKTTQENYPNMAALLAGIRAHDREPRGEADFVPSAIRMAAATCIQGK